MPRPRTKTVILTLIALLIVAALCLNLTSRVSVTPSGMMIRSPGTYQHKKLFATLTVHDGIVYLVASTDTIPANSFSDTLGSDYMRWFLFIENNGRVWANSSDIGTSIWTPDESGTFIESNLTPDNTELIKAMPDPVYNNMPSDLQRRWATIRSTEIQPD